MRRRNVFINIPFDNQYEPLYIALIVGLVGIGLIPRSSLEVPIVARGGRRPRERLRLIFELLRSCELSLHDLSRVQLSSSAPRCPRFNMPFEAGLAVALSWSGNKNRWYILEAMDYRLQKSLSDLNGHDPFIHGGSVQGVLMALTDILGCGVRPFILDNLHSNSAVKPSSANGPIRSPSSSRGSESQMANLRLQI